MLTTLTKVLAKAHRGGYAVPAFNFNNLETALAAEEAARALASPLILQTSEGAVAYAGMESLAAIAHAAAKRLGRIPVVFHLDHGKDPGLVARAVRSGLYTSVMIDASGLPYKENVRVTRRIVALAHRRGVSVEAELGAIAGIEDFVDVSERDVKFTNPEEAARFVRETGCDALAIAIGTAHGAYKFKGETRLDIERLRRIKALVRMPLVLHGASGVNPEWVAMLSKKCDLVGDCARLEGAKGVADAVMRAAVKGGVNKVNIDTDLRIAFTAGTRQAILDDPKAIDPRKILGPARELMRKVCEHKMMLLGSKGKA